MRCISARRTLSARSLMMGLMLALWLWLLSLTPAHLAFPTTAPVAPAPQLLGPCNGHMLPC